jgi:hypothetical protein
MCEGSLLNCMQIVNQLCNELKCSEVTTDQISGSDTETSNGSRCALPCDKNVNDLSLGDLNAHPHVCSQINQQLFFLNISRPEKNWNVHEFRILDTALCL